MTTSHGNRDIKNPKATNLDEKYIREFNRLMKETRAFNRKIDEDRRRRGFL